MLNNNVQQDKFQRLLQLNFAASYKSNPQGITKTHDNNTTMGKCDVFPHQHLIATSTIYHILAA